jgi:hypothetical protein
MTTKSLPPSYSSLYNTSSSKSNKRSKSNNNYDKPLPINNQVIYEQLNPNNRNNQVIYERPDPNNRNKQFIYEESNGHTNSIKNPYYQSSIKNTNGYYSSNSEYNTNPKKYHGPVNNTTSSGNVKVTEKKYIYKNGVQKEQISQTEYIFNKNDIPYISGDRLLDYNEKKRLLDDRYKSEILNLESQRIYKKIYAYNSYNSQVLT